MTSHERRLWMALVLTFVVFAWYERKERLAWMADCRHAEGEILILMGQLRTADQAWTRQHEELRRAHGIGGTLDAE